MDIKVVYLYMDINIDKFIIQIGGNKLWIRKKSIFPYSLYIYII